MILAHKIALDPTCKQMAALARAAGCARFAYNWGLNEWKTQYAAGAKPTAASIKKRFNEIKEVQFPWIYDSPKDANQQAFTDLGNAFNNFFKSVNGKRNGRRVAFPKFHKKGRRDSFYVSNDKFSLSGKSVKLPVIGKVKTREELRLQGKILSARVSRTADKWFISVQVESEARVPNTPKHEIVGVDLGLKTALVTSTGREFFAPKPLFAALKTLKRASRILARRKKGSSNRRKAAMRVARIHARVANIRKDFVSKVTTKLCRENQAVVIEDLNVTGMLRNPRLARAISDVGFGMFGQQVRYKAEKFGCTLVVADRWFPSSKRCHMCGNVKEKLDLSERTYVCEACGLVEDRDVNAAINLEMYPRLVGNKTPVDTRTKARRQRRVSSVAEAGTNPCAQVRTI